GKEKDQDDIRKDIYENLMIFLKELKGHGDQIIWDNQSQTEEEKSAKKFQELGQKAKLASRQKCFPASLIIDPNSDCLDVMQQTVGVTK
ncbi:hypothetical protein HET73_04810, partial [Wolbachia endosymbiont of Atemnus politus]|uniref:hypothetical protein n=1 Tax=Wolbachia endosymbiont of Atemnus politus TaxID=2682840 RepID=UPI001571D16F